MLPRDDASPADGSAATTSEDQLELPEHHAWEATKEPAVTRLGLGRSLLIASAAIALLVAAGGFAYGAVLARSAKSVRMIQGQVAKPVTAPVEAASVTATAEVPPPDPNSPLASDIPGCVCHSDDQRLAEEHAEYRMNQCFACHIGGVPTGQK